MTVVGYRVAFKGEGKDELDRQRIANAQLASARGVVIVDERTDSDLYLDDAPERHVALSSALQYSQTGAGAAVVVISATDKLSEATLVETRHYASQRGVELVLGEVQASTERTVSSS